MQTDGRKQRKHSANNAESDKRRLSGSAEKMMPDPKCRDLGPPTVLFRSASEADLSTIEDTTEVNMEAKIQGIVQ